MSNKEPTKTSWLSRLRGGLKRSSTRLRDGIGDLVGKRRLDSQSLEQLEELLITADLGVSTAARLVRSVAARRFDKDVTTEVVCNALADEIETIITPVAKPLHVDPDNRPHVILVCGVNGGGKTTTIGKLARQFTDEGKQVMLAAADTFRAAAVEQLQVWGERTGCRVIATGTGGEPAGLVFEAMDKARTEGVDILIIDTAGRLHNRSELMAELQKVIRVIKKHDDTAPHCCLLVLDATIGQNAHNQVEAFRNMVDVNGLIITKLDGTAKGGVVVALAETFALPIHAVGVGEGINDLQAFDPKEFSRSLMGLE